MTKKEVIEYFGSPARAARLLRISRSSITQWPDVLTDRIAFRVELATNGALKSDETLQMEKIKGDAA